MSDEHYVAIDVTALGVSEYTLSLFLSGHPRDAIRHEAQDLLNELQEQTKRQDLDGPDLVQAALADNDPLVAFSERRTRRERNEHAGTRFLLLGMVRGFRNPYSHDVRIAVTQEEAVIWLGVLGTVRRQLELAREFAAASNSESPH